MAKIEWCIRKKAYELIEPNPNLAEAYFRKAEEALSSIKVNTVKDWQIATAYYTIYFSLYAILMRIGVKCEVHACTLAFVRSFLSEYFSREDCDSFESSLQARADAQYYVDRTVPDEQYQLMLRKAPDVLVQCKAVAQHLTEKKVEELREHVQKAMVQSKRKGS
ncbi:MAG TPA: hypothetical protein VJG90_08215 [Candidatus Nanoarchaeia archaeon]|nr:hypothetical protein [Candidatus Nanoarchaeia archaeon]